MVSYSVENWSASVVTVAVLQTKGSRNLRALGCSVPSAARAHSASICLVLVSSLLFRRKGPPTRRLFC